MLDSIVARRTARQRGRAEHSARLWSLKKISKTASESSYSCKSARSKIVSSPSSPSSFHRPITRSTAVQTDLRGWQLAQALGSPTVIVHEVCKTGPHFVSSARPSNTLAPVAVTTALPGQARSTDGSCQSTPRKPAWDWEYHRQWSERAFAQLDANKDGELERRELNGRIFDRLMRELLSEHLPQSFDTNAFRQFIIRLGDVDGNGFLSRGEFQFFTWRLKCMDQDLDLEADFIFSIFDADRDGRLSRNEFTQLFKFWSKDNLPNSPGASSQAYIDKQYKELDKDGDGFITKQEFKIWSSGFLTPRPA